MPESMWRVGTCICKLLNFCNVSNQSAISTIRLQYRRIAVWLLRLQSDCWDGCLIAEIAVWFWKLVKIRGPEREASHWLRAHNQGLWLVERTRFKKFKALAFRSEISLIQFIPDGNLYNQTAICIIRLQYKQLDSNHYNQTAISTIELQSTQSDINEGGLQSDCWDCSLIFEVSQNWRTWNWGFPLVEIPKLRPLIGWEDRI